MDAASNAGLIALVWIVFGFVVCRAIVLWYWRVNRIVTLLEQQTALLVDLRNAARGLPSPLDTTRATTSPAAAPAAAGGAPAVTRATP